MGEIYRQQLEVNCHHRLYLGGMHSLSAPLARRRRQYALRFKADERCGESHTEALATQGLQQALCCAGAPVTHCSNIASNIALSNWMIAICLCSIHLKGTSPIRIQKGLRFSQKSAWHMAFHVPRVWLLTCDGPFVGMLEAGDCYSGGKESKHHRAKKLNTRRGTVRKVARTEAKCPTASIVLVEVMDHADERSLTSIVSSEAQSGATVFTNESQAYNRLRKMGYKHRSVAPIAGQQMDGMARPSGLREAWASIERWDQGTPPSMSSEHVNHCVNRLRGRNSIRTMKLGSRTARQDGGRATHS